MEDFSAVFGTSHATGKEQEAHYLDSPCSTTAESSSMVQARSILWETRAQVLVPHVLLGMVASVTHSRMLSYCVRIMLV